MSALDFFRSNGMASEHIRSALQLPTCVPPPAVHSLGWVRALRPPRAAARCRLGLPSLREPPGGRASVQGPDPLLAVLARTRAVEPVVPWVLSSSTYGRGLRWVGKRSRSTLPLPQKDHSSHALCTGILRHDHHSVMAW